MTVVYRSPVALKQLNIYLTDSCNLACRRCWSPVPRSKNGRSHRILPAALAMKSVMEALPLGLQAIRLSGSEPLTHPEIEHLLDFLESLELSVQVETSGSGMTPRLALRLRGLPQCSAAIGFLGPDAATHDALEGTPGAFDRAVYAARLLARTDVTPQIIFPILRSNQTMIPAMIQLAETLGAGAIYFSVPQAGSQVSWSGSIAPAGDQLKHAGLPVDEGLLVEELIALGRRIERELAVGTRVQMFFDQPPAFRGLYAQARLESQGHCNFLNVLGLLSSGQYALCGVGPRAAELVIGRAGIDPLEKVWRSDATLLSLRQGLPGRLTGVCERCVLKASCLGYCVAENYFRTGSFWEPHWFCSAAESVGLFPAGRLVENRL